MWRRLGNKEDVLAEFPNAQPDGWMVGGWIDGGHMDSWVHYACMNAWMNGGLGIWIGRAIMDRWVEEWMEGWWVDD